jgi:phosphatidate cytidylyltransferase/cell division cycle 2-like protein
MLTVPNAVASPPFDGTTATAASTTTLVALVSPERLHWIGYSLSLLGWMTWVIRLNTTGGTRDGKEGEGAATDATANRQHRFLSAWGEVAAHHMSILATLVPLSAWMKLLRSGRMEWALYASLLVICNDTFAYLVGHFAGLRPLLLTISPNKTVEGWAGGFLLTTLASPLIWRRLFEGKPYSFHSLHFALFASVVAPFGGFLASAAKRAYAKKDFGSLLGSHGGLMDRLDCQLITAPYLYLYLATMGEL